MYVQFTLGEAQEFWLDCHKNVSGDSSTFLFL
jgi:hypothetical protein